LLVDFFFDVLKRLPKLLYNTYPDPLSATSRASLRKTVSSIHGYKPLRIPPIIADEDIRTIGIITGE